MKQITDIKEKQKIALGILVYLDEYCKKNGINYMLAYGTMLGAVRHNGFIPWDDDVDVMMLRSDYEKFCAAYKNDHPYYKFFTWNNGTFYNLPLAKIADTRTLLKQNYGFRETTDLGIYVDIFVIDNFPDDDNLGQKMYEKADRFKKLWKMSVIKMSASSSNILTWFSRTLISLFCRMVGYRYFLKKYDDLAQGLKNQNTINAGVIIYGEGYKKEKFAKAVCCDLIQHDFEGYLFPIPSNYNLYLSQIYGDYMTLPPVEQRKVHLNDTYWK